MGESHFFLQIVQCEDNVSVYQSLPIQLPDITLCSPLIRLKWAKNDSGEEMNLSLFQNLAMRDSENRGFVQKFSRRTK